MPRALHFGAILLFTSISVTCAERTLDDDDVRSACKDTCAQARRCDLAPEDTGTQDQCVERCIPAFQNHREHCESALELLACVAKLTCDDQSMYETVIMRGDFKEIYEGKYPCDEETVADQEDCF